MEHTATLPMDEYNELMKLKANFDFVRDSVRKHCALLQDSNGVKNLNAVFDNIDFTKSPTGVMQLDMTHSNDPFIHIVFKY